MSSFSTVAVLAYLIGATAVAAQGPPEQSTTARSGPPMRILGPAISFTTEPLGAPSGIRSLPGGRVLVNDGSRRRLLLFDSTMKLIKVVADSVSNVASAYGLIAGRLLPYRGDSSLLLDRQTLSMLVIDGEGNIVKVRAIPRTEHATYLATTSITYGNPGFDAQGRLIYRIFDPSTSLSMVLGGGIMVPTQPDSAPVLRMNLDTRKLDTAGKVKIQKRTTIATQSPTGGISMRTTTNPMPVLDDWAVTADGSLALLRHRDYSIDWLRPDGRWESTPPMPFDWTRITDENKKAFVDSLRTQLENSRRMSMARYDSINHVCFDMDRTMGPPLTKEVREAIKARSGRAGAAGAPIAPVAAADVARATAATAVAGRGAPPPPSGAAPAAPVAGPPMPPVQPCPPGPYPAAAMMFGPPPNVIPYTELPDYKPPFAANSMRADADGNVWIRVNQMKPVPGTYQFDIANNKGELFDRIQMPIARTLVGFGPGNIVYVIGREGTTVRLERVRWR